MKWLAFAWVLVGCGSTQIVQNATRGRSGREAQLCLDDGAPRPGQALRVQRTVCGPDPRATDRVRCALQPIGSGEVVRAVDAHCAIVRIASKVAIVPSDVIELAGEPLPAGKPTAVASRVE